MQSGQWYPAAQFYDLAALAGDGNVEALLLKASYSPQDDHVLVSDVSGDEVTGGTYARAAIDNVTVDTLDDGTATLATTDTPSFGDPSDVAAYVAVYRTSDDKLLTLGDIEDDGTGDLTVAFPSGVIGRRGPRPAGLVTSVNGNGPDDDGNVTVSGGTGASALADLTDVAIPSPDDRNILAFSVMAGNKWVSAPLGAISEDWHIVGESGEPSFQNSWNSADTAFGGGTGLAKARFRLIGDVVFVEGILYGGMPNTVVWTMPTGYRPDSQIVLGFGGANDLGSPALGGISGFLVEADGDLKISDSYLFNPAADIAADENPITNPTGPILTTLSLQYRIDP